MSSYKMGIYFQSGCSFGSSNKEEQTSSDDLTGSETILIVEDDDALRNLVREILMRQGYRILEAENGIEALRVSDEHEGQIHLMITDVVMRRWAAGNLKSVYVLCALK